VSHPPASGVKIAPADNATQRGRECLRIFVPNPPQKNHDIVVHVGWLSVNIGLMEFIVILLFFAVFKDEYNGYPLTFDSIKLRLFVKFECWE